MKLKLLCVATLLCNCLGYIIRTSPTGDTCGEVLLNNKPAFFTCPFGGSCDLATSKCVLDRREPLDRCESSKQCKYSIDCKPHFDKLSRCGGGYSFKLFKPFGLFNATDNIHEFDIGNAKIGRFDCSEHCDKEFLALYDHDDILGKQRCACSSNIEDLVNTKLYTEQYSSQPSICDALGKYQNIMPETTYEEYAVSPLPKTNCTQEYSYYSGRHEDNSAFIYRLHRPDVTKNNNVGNKLFGMSEKTPFVFKGYFKRKSTKIDMSCYKERCATPTINQTATTLCDNCKCDNICKNNVYMAVGDVQDINPPSLTCLCADSIEDLVVDPQTMEEIPSANYQTCQTSYIARIMSEFNIKMVNNSLFQGAGCEAKYHWATQDDGDMIAVYIKSNINDQTFVQPQTFTVAKTALIVVASIVGFIILVYGWSQLSDVDYDDEP